MPFPSWRAGAVNDNHKSKTPAGRRAFESDSTAQGPLGCVRLTHTLHRGEREEQLLRVHLVAVDREQTCYLLWVKLQTQALQTRPDLREAALAVAVEIFQQRTSPGGQIQSVDFTPAPHRLGRSLLTRVMGLIAPYMSMGGFVG